MVFCFAGYTVLGKELGETDLFLFKPLLFLLLRHWLAAAILVLITTFREGVQLPHRQDLFLIFTAGFTGITYAQLTFLYGVWFSSATYAAMLEPLCPIFSACIALAFGLETLSLYKCFCIGVAIVGASITTFFRTDTANSFTTIIPNEAFTIQSGKLATVLGTTVILNAVLGQALFVVLVQKVHKTGRYKSAAWLTTWFVCIGAVCTSIVAMISLLFSPDFAWPGSSTFHTSTTFWLEVLYAATIATVQNYTIRAWAVTKIGPTGTAMYQTLNPLLTCLLAWWFLHEVPNFQQAFGTVFIVSAFVLMVIGETEGSSSTPMKKKIKAGDEEGDYFDGVDNDENRKKSILHSNRPILSGDSLTSSPLLKLRSRVKVVGPVSTTNEIDPERRRLLDVENNISEDDEESSGAEEAKGNESFLSKWSFSPSPGSYISRAKELGATINE
eukprot:g3084.t1